MYQCKTCSKEFTSRHSYIGHCSSHNRGESYKIGRKKKVVKKEKVCKYCLIEFKSGQELGGHQINCKKNPNYESQRNSINYRISDKCKGRKLSEEHKNKLSDSMKKYLDENPGNIPYLKNHSSKESYPERVFRKALTRRGIEGWKQELPLLRYSLDFCFIKEKIDIEIDGGTHKLKSVIEKDTERDKKLTDLGWKIIRIDAREIIKNADLIIDNLLEIGMIP